MPGAPFSEADRARVRFHLGYPELIRDTYRAGGGTAFDMPPVDTSIIESTFDQLTVNAIPRVLELLGVLDGLLLTLADAPSRFAVSELEGVKLRTGRPGESETDLVQKEISRWAKMLAGTLDVPMGPAFVNYMNPPPKRGGSAMRYIS